MPRSSLTTLLRAGDLVIANDAATLPACLRGVHIATGREIEVRLAARMSLAPDAVDRFTAIVFGTGDYRTRTENRTLPPPLAAGDALRLGPLPARIERLLDHPRLIALRFEADTAAIWRGIASHGRPIQYAHMTAPLELWDVWTPIAGPVAAFEPPSAGFVLDWRVLGQLRERGIEFATLTHAAGISSTGDPQLDRRLPFEEPYRIPRATAAALARACREHRRVVAIGTTVVRALEHAAIHAAARGGAIRAGEGIADQRIGASTHLRVVDAVLSGTHEPGTSHYELLRAFATSDALQCADQALERAGFATHEFGDSVLIERSTQKYSDEVEPCASLEDHDEMQVLVATAAPRILRAFSRAPVHVVQESRRVSSARRLGCLCR
jgi:S-adenosylmethionine:tRNA ribosyltransferase-isomerase